MFKFTGTVMGILMCDDDSYNIQITLESGTGITLECAKKGAPQIGQVITFSGQ